MQPPAVVMNMFYTGLGIARSLGRRGIPVIGLTAQRRIYGNYTRYARTVFCPDSRKEPDALLAFLLQFAKEAGGRGVLFPTRDDDLIFLDRFREELSVGYELVAPARPALGVCLNKWQTYLCATRAGVATPKCWLIQSVADVSRAAPEVTYPCVLKPLAAHDWRRGDNWEIVGGRKAVPIQSREELRAEYARVSRADSRALLQEMIPGGDDRLTITACYIARDGNLAAAFGAQKLLQEPAGFGTGCIVQTVQKPELLGPTERLLRAMSFTGIAEVEYKWDEAAACYKLIEVNPRPWDQHILGNASGVDLIYLAYCDHAGLAMPGVQPATTAIKWIAEDVFLMTVLRSLKRRDGKVLSLFRLARGNRVYGIWSARDPLPFLGYFAGGVIPQLAWTGVRRFWTRLNSRFARRTLIEKGAS